MRGFCGVGFGKLFRNKWDGETIDLRLSTQT